MSAPSLDGDVGRFYALGGEQARLAQGVFQLERTRTEELLQRHLPPPPARLLDVGGGPGAYSCLLAGLGYTVTLVDPVPLHVEQARQACAAHLGRAIASCEIGDARHLAHADASVDAVLLLGPLYHLPEAEDRARAWAEARRVLRPGGVVLAAGISRFASLLECLKGGRVDPVFDRMVERDLLDGRHVNDSGRPEYFTTAFFHRPDELAAEARAAGFENVMLYGIEGPGWMLQDFDARWADAGGRARILAAARAVEQEPSIVGLSAHILAVATRPKGVA